MFSILLLSSIANYWWYILPLLSPKMILGYWGITGFWFRGRTKQYEWKEEKEYKKCLQTSPSESQNGKQGRIESDIGRIL